MSTNQSHSAWNKLQPQDTFYVCQNDYFSADSNQLLRLLYQPIMGVTAFSLYQTLWGEIKQPGTVSVGQLHSELLMMLSIDLPSLYEARTRLEALGLLRTFVKEESYGQTFYYELQKPMNYDVFFRDELLSVLLLDCVGTSKFQQLQQQFTFQPLNKRQLTEKTLAFFDVIKIDKTKIIHPVQAITDAQQQFTTTKTHHDWQMEQHFQYDWALIQSSLQTSFIDYQSVEENQKNLLALGAFYGLDELQMVQFIEDASDLNTGQLSLPRLKNKLQAQFKRRFHFEEASEKVNRDVAANPTEKKAENRTPKTEEKQAWNQKLQAEMDILLQQSVNFKPLDFLRKIKIQKGGFATDNELKIIQNLVNRHQLNDDVLNILIHYILGAQNKVVLTKAYVERIADEWSQKGIVDGKSAITEVLNFRKEKSEQKAASAQRQKNWSGNYQKKGISKETLPEWAKEDYQPDTEQASAAELEAIEAQLKRLRGE